MVPVLILHEDPEQVRPYVEAQFPEIEFVFITHETEVASALSKHNPRAVFSIKCPTLPGPIHRLAVNHPSVEWAHVGGSGFDHLTPLDRTGLRVTNSAGVLSAFLAETVMGAMLVLNGNLLDYVKQARQKIWQPIPFRPLSEKTLLIVGLGQIGTHLARNAKNLGMRVLATRRSATPSEFVDEIHPPDELSEVLGQADFVSIHVRLDETTTHLFNADVIASMRRGAALINTSRGPVVDEAALIAALDSGHVGSAYLDVFETEPLPQDSPLWEMNNVLITPHAADQVDDWPCRFAQLFASNLRCWLDGDQLSHQVYDGGHTSR